MADLYSPFQVALADRDAAARAFQAAGGKVIGYIGNTTPVELIAAAGAFPLRLAARAEATPLGDRYMEELFDPIVRAVFEKMLEGAYAFVDAVILPRTSDSVQRLYYYLCEVRKMGETIPEPLLYDLLHTPWYSSAEYNMARTAELAGHLERITGKAVDAAAIAAAITDSNRKRSLLNAFADLRRADPPKVTGSHAQPIYAANQVMPAADFEAALGEVLARAAPITPGPRIVLAGSAQDSTALHAMVEAAGGVVVGDFHEFGEPMIGAKIDLVAPPMRALTDHYHRGVASSRTFPQSAAPLLAFAKACAADGVLFYFFSEEEALTWEYPSQRRALQADGVGTLCFEDMPHRPDAAAIGSAVKGFVDGLRAGAMA